MTERIYRGKMSHQAKVRVERLRDLKAMQEYTGRPVPNLVDEALSVYLAAFMTSPEYQEWCEEIERKIDELRERDDFDFWDIGYMYDV